MSAYSAYRRVNVKLPRISIRKIDSARAATIVRKARIKRGISLRNLAGRMGITPGYLSDLELGRRNWTERRFQQAKKILG
jgi:ribosome-binding protein aMBF1 (putative translation factor)